MNFRGKPMKNSLFSSIFFACMIGMSTSCLHADSTYTLISYPQFDGQHLYQYSWSGTIATDGATGYIGSSDILSASLSITKAKGGEVHMATWGPEEASVAFGAGTLLATDAALFYSPSTLTGGSDEITITGISDMQVGYGIQGTPSDPLYLTYFGREPGGIWVWGERNDGFGYGGVFRIASRSVPEPSTLALLLTATLGGLLWWRRRK
jgi:hypothetical protein